MFQNWCVCCWVPYCNIDTLLQISKISRSMHEFLQHHFHCNSICLLLKTLQLVTIGGTVLSPTISNHVSQGFYTHSQFVSILGKHGNEFHSWNRLPIGPANYLHTLMPSICGSNKPTPCIFLPGSLCDAFDGRLWYSAIILLASTDKFLVHYLGFDHTSDQWRFRKYIREASQSLDKVGYGWRDLKKINS